MNHSAYLGIPLRSLRDLAGEVEQQISDISDVLTEPGGERDYLLRRLGRLLDRWTMAERVRREEDASLIAAAPELYEALIAMASMKPCECHACSITRAAISKARGEP